MYIQFVFEKIMFRERFSSTNQYYDSNSAVPQFNTKGSDSNAIECIDCFERTIL